MRKILLVLPFLILFACSSTPESGSSDGSSTSDKPSTVAEARDRAATAMDKAKSIKADVAVKDEYNNALSAFNEAEDMNKSNAGQESVIDKYMEAERLFLAVYDDALAKREEALKQMEKADSEIKEVEDEAQEYEKEVTEGGTN